MSPTTTISTELSIAAVAVVAIIIIIIIIFVKCRPLQTVFYVSVKNAGHPSGRMVAGSQSILKIATTNGRNHDTHLMLSARVDVDVVALEEWQLIAGTQKIHRKRPQVLDICMQNAYRRLIYVQLRTDLKPRTE